MKLLIITFFMLLTFNAWSGQEGNGGRGVLREDGKLYLLDLVEAGIYKNAFFNLDIEVDQSMKERVEDVFEHLPVVDTDLVAIKLQEIRNRYPRLAYVMLRTMELYLWNLVDFDLINPDDLNTIIDEDYCKEKCQLLALRKNASVYINELKISKIDKKNIVALIFHEVIYAIADSSHQNRSLVKEGLFHFTNSNLMLPLNKGKINTSELTRLVSYLFTKNWRRNSQDHLFDMLNLKFFDESKFYLINGRSSYAREFFGSKYNEDLHLEGNSSGIKLTVYPIPTLNYLKQNASSNPAWSGIAKYEVDEGDDLYYLMWEVFEKSIAIPEFDRFEQTVMDTCKYITDLNQLDHPNVILELRYYANHYDAGFLGGTSLITHGSYVLNEKNRFIKLHTINGPDFDSLDDCQQKLLSSRYKLREFTNMFEEFDF